MENQPLHDMRARGFNLLKPVKTIAAAILLAGLASCGGGGDSAPASAPASAPSVGTWDSTAWDDCLWGD